MVDAVNSGLDIGDLSHIYVIHCLRGCLTAFSVYAALHFPFPACATTVENTVLGEIERYDREEMAGG